MGKKPKIKPQKKAKPRGFDDLLEAAEAALAQFEYEQACEFFRQALLIQPDNTDIMDRLGELLVSYVGDEERGRQVLLQSVHVEPEKGYSKYMTLGQLAGGKEGLEFYRRGVLILNRDLAAATDPQEQVELACALSQGFCAVAELWFTDLCDEEGAETQCEQAIANAISAGPANPEAHSMKAQHLLRQCKMEESKASILHAVQLLSTTDEEHMPSMEMRIEMAKLLMQVEEWANGYKLLKSLLLEDDGNGFVWYLMGECLRYMGKYRRSLRHLLRAKGIASRVANLPHDEGEGEGPLEFLAKVDNILMDVANKLGDEAATLLNPRDEDWVTDSEDEQEKEHQAEAALAAEEAGDDVMN